MATILRGRLHYAWIIFGVTFLALLASAGVRSTPGILIVPLEQEFGWDRATVSLAVSIKVLLAKVSLVALAVLLGRAALRARGSARQRWWRREISALAAVLALAGLLVSLPPPR